MSSFLKNCTFCNGFILFLFLSFSIGCLGQGEFKGVVKDDSNGEVVPFVNVLIDGTLTGTTTDFDGEFSLTNVTFPVTIEYSFVGYEPIKVTYNSAQKKIVVKLKSLAINIDQADVLGDRISDKQKQQPLTVESMDVRAIKEAPSGNFYEGLGNLKGVEARASIDFFEIKRLWSSLASVKYVTLGPAARGDPV